MTVIRFHANPDPALRGSDCTDAHHARVRRYCAELAARLGLPTDGSDLLTAAAHHDDAETVMGDWPAPYCALPHVAAFKASEEHRILLALGTPGYPWQLSDEEAKILKLADKADAWRHAAKRRRQHTDDWPEAKRRLYALAWSIGPAAVAWWEEFAKEAEQ